jgi:hypothetical protein
VINSIDFCSKNDSVYVLIASLDCSVSLNDLKGNLIGIFGQETHWKIETAAHTKQTGKNILSHSHMPKSSGKSAKSSKSSVNFKDEEAKGNGVQHTKK